MDNKTIRTHINNHILTGLMLAMAACGGGGGSEPDPDCRLSADGKTVSPGCQGVPTITPVPLPMGIWRGVDSDGGNVVAFVALGATSVRFQFIDGLGNQGSGDLAVGPGDHVSSTFQLITPQGAAFADGSTLADCTLSGTIVTRESLTLFETCTTRTGLAFQDTLVLSFDNLYDRNASLAQIAGMYETPVGSILSIASDGGMFVQDAVSGCVTNGLVSTPLLNGNIYEVQYEIDNCIGQDAIWNGSIFNGLAVLDNTFSPELLTIAVIGDFGGVAISLVVEYERL